MAKFIIYKDNEGGRDFQTGKIMFIKHRARIWTEIFRDPLIRLTNLTRSEGLSKEAVELEGLMEARF